MSDFFIIVICIPGFLFSAAILGWACHKIGIDEWINNIGRKK